MPKKCIVKNCISLKNETFHRIPKDFDQRNIWLDLLDLPETANGRVCSKHFDPSDFEVKGDGHIWLKRFTNPKQVEHERVEFVNNVSDEVDIEIQIDDEIILDTIVDLRMDCSVNKIYHKCVYEEHSYSRFLNKHLDMYRQYRRPELRFEVKFCSILKEADAS